MNILALGMIGMPELVLIGFIALLVYGKKLPEMARSLGKSVQEFKSGMQENAQIPSEKDSNSKTALLPQDTDEPQ